MDYRSSIADEGILADSIRNNDDNIILITTWYDITLH